MPWREKKEKKKKPSFAYRESNTGLLGHNELS